MCPISRLRISSCRRRIESVDGKPFFYLGDTAWELLHRLTLSEAREYLGERARQGFNVVQMAALAELDGLRTPTPGGHLPFEDCDPARPSAPYWDHVEQVVRLANGLGIYAGLLPTWGDKWNRGAGAGPEIFNPATAGAYGRWLGRRFRDAGVVWILGGDRPVENSRQRETLEAMARGLREGDGGRGLITFHPPGGKTSRDFWADAEWLDFDMFQSGHCILALENWHFARCCRAGNPPRPFLDGEPCYEDHEVMLPEWRPVKPGWRFGAWEVRRAAWWSVLSGACGHVYGAQPCWMMWEEGREPLCGVARSWRDALALPGALQMRRVRDIAENLGFPFEPLDGFVRGSHEGWEGRPVAGRSAANDRGTVLIYSPLAQTLRIETGGLARGAWGLAQISPAGPEETCEILRGVSAPGEIVVSPRLVHFSPDALLLFTHEL